MGCKKVEDYWLFVSNEQEVIESVRRYIDGHDLLGASVRSQLFCFLEKVKNRTVQRLRQLAITELDKKIDQLYYDCLNEINGLIDIKSPYPNELKLLSSLKSNAWEQELRTTVSWKGVHSTYDELFEKLNSLQSFCSIDIFLDGVLLKHQSKKEKLVRLCSHIDRDKKELLRLRGSAREKDLLTVETLITRIKKDEIKAQKIEKSLKGTFNDGREGICRLINTNDNEFKVNDKIFNELALKSEQLETLEFKAKVYNDEAKGIEPFVVISKRLKTLMLLATLFVVLICTPQAFIATKKWINEKTLSRDELEQTIKNISIHPFFKRYFKKEDFLKISGSQSEQELRENLKVLIRRKADGAMVSRDIGSIFLGWDKMPIQAKIDTAKQNAIFFRSEESLKRLREKFGKESQIFLKTLLSSDEVELMTMSEDGNATVIPLSIVCNSQGGFQANAIVNLPLGMKFEVGLDYPFKNYYGKAFKSHGYCP